MEIDVTTNAELVARAKKAYDAVREWPERRGGPGFMDLLALRNIVPELIDAIERLSSGGGWRFDMENAPRDAAKLLFGWTRDNHIETGWYEEGQPVGANSGYWRVKDWPDCWMLIPSLPTPPGASSGEVASPAVEAARRQLHNALRLCEKDGSAMVSVPFRVDELRALLAAPPSPDQIAAARRDAAQTAGWIRKGAALARREERERCAKLCDEVHRSNLHSVGISLGSDARAMTAYKLAERIRALADPPQAAEDGK